MKRRAGKEIELLTEVLERPQLVIGVDVQGSFEASIDRSRSGGDLSLPAVQITVTYRKTRKAEKDWTFCIFFANVSVCARLENKMCVLIEHVRF